MPEKSAEGLLRALCRQRKSALPSSHPHPRPAPAQYNYSSKKAHLPDQPTVEHFLYQASHLKMISVQPVGEQMDEEQASGFHPPCNFGKQSLQRDGSFRLVFFCKPFKRRRLNCLRSVLLQRADPTLTL